MKKGGERERESVCVRERERERKREREREICMYIFANKIFFSLSSLDFYFLRINFFLLQGRLLAIYKDNSK